MPTRVDEGGDVRLGPGAVVAEDLAGRDRGEAAATGEVETPSQSEEEAAA